MIVRRPRRCARFTKPRCLEDAVGVVRSFRFELAGSASSSGVDVAAEATERQAGTARQHATRMSVDLAGSFCRPAAGQAGCRNACRGISKRTIVALKVKVVTRARGEHIGPSQARLARVYVGKTSTHAPEASLRPRCDRQKNPRSTQHFPAHEASAVSSAARPAVMASASELRLAEAAASKLVPRRRQRRAPAPSESPSSR